VTAPEPWSTDNYRFDHWKSSSRVGYALTGIGAAALAAIPGAPTFLRIDVAVAGVMLLAASWTTRKPAVESQDGLPVLRLRLHSHGPTLIFAVLFVFGAVTTWGAATSSLPKGLIVVGLATLLFGGIATGLGLTLGRNRMIFGRSTLRVISPVQGHDREFAWSDISDVTLGPSPRNAGTPVVTLSCPAHAVVERSTAQFLAGEFRPAADRWILPAGWTVEPNALPATIRYLAANPTERATVTVEQVTRMLTPPRY
jgi:hypothetical protein